MWDSGRFSTGIWGGSLGAGNLFSMHIQQAATLGLQGPYCGGWGCRDHGARWHSVGSLLWQVLEPTLLVAWLQ